MSVGYEAPRFALEFRETLRPPFSPNHLLAFAHDCPSINSILPSFENTIIKAREYVRKEIKNMADSDLSPEGGCGQLVQGPSASAVGQAYHKMRTEIMVDLCNRQQNQCCYCTRPIRPDMLELDTILPVNYSHTVSTSFTQRRTYWRIIHAAGLAGATCLNCNRKKGRKERAGLHTLRTLRKGTSHIVPSATVAENAFMRYASRPVWTGKVPYKVKSTNLSRASEFELVGAIKHFALRVTRGCDCWRQDGGGHEVRDMFVFYLPLCRTLVITCQQHKLAKEPVVCRIVGDAAECSGDKASVPDAGSPESAAVETETD